MGIQDRDYYREGPSFFDRVGQQGATVWLIAITVGVFFGQYLSLTRQGPWFSQLANLGCYDTEAILEGEVWRLITSAFLHAGVFHLFFNMLVLYWAGQRLEELYGPREFVIFYLLSALAANLFRLCVEQVGLAPPSFAVGASGATAAVFVLFACHYPHAQVRIWFILPVPAWLLALLYVALAALGGLGDAVRQGPQFQRGAGVGHLAHLGGAFFGFLYYQSGIRFSALLPRRREAARVRPRLRVHAPPVEPTEPEPVGAPVEAPARPADEQLEAKLDAVLAKVAKHGQESLTPEEREILFKASELYKKRRK
jgi:membrane associated rhomboid family serine protease